VEKRKPHHDLAAFKKSFSSPQAVRLTKAALKDAQALGFTLAMMVEVVQSMRSAHFYKSMTSLGDSTRWQDVYHVPWDDDLLLYIKFTDDLITEFLLLSFKEK
jgi:motility quorum-sensing regulator/GCU-specific mRNA interferase toxin